MSENSRILEKNAERGEVVNSKIRKFFFKFRDQEIERDLRVTIRVVPGETIDGQKIVIDITNDINPVFLFILFITHADFDVLRNDQGINVDFKDFPSALVNLLDKCAEGITSNTGGTFKLMLDNYCGTVGGSCLMDTKKITVKILEECSFKNMCHLTLDVLRGSDMQIQHKLEMELCKTKQCLSQESKLHDDALKKISELVEETTERNKEVEKLNSIINEMKTQEVEGYREQQRQSELREKQIQEDCEKKISHEREQFQKKFEKSQNKIKALEEEVSRINESHRELAAQFLEKERELEITKAELIAAKQDVNLLKNQNSKLDSDYHDKEKAVNILRTRLAVAEQELKDNNILLLNHQNKLDEASQEKSDLQKNLDFIKTKLEKKESVVLNLSEELLKGNEIISKQQAKISIVTAKLQECEELIAIKDKLVEEKDNIVQNNNEIIAKLQDDLRDVNKLLSTCNDKINFLDTSLKEKQEKYESCLKLITCLKENVQTHNSILKPNSSQKSLLFYRAFLSTPSLLPSDECRRMIDLKYPLLNEYHYDFYLDSNYDITQSKRSAKRNCIVETYIERYSKRLMSVPLSLFRSSEIPVTVLSSPEGLAVSQAMHNIPRNKSSSSDPFNNYKENIIQNKNEYLAFTTAAGPFPTRVVSDSSLINSDLINGCHQSLLATCSSSNDSDRVHHVFDYQKEPNPQYAPVGAFRLRPMERNTNLISNSTRSGLTTMNTDKTRENPFMMKPSLRKTPAITAPPLTRQQKEAKESALKLRQSQLRKPQTYAGLTRSFKAKSTQIPDPLNVAVSNSAEDNHQHVPKSNHHHISTGQFIKSSAKLCHLNPSKKNYEEPEPSAYFIVKNKWCRFTLA